MNRYINIFPIYIPTYFYDVYITYLNTQILNEYNEGCLILVLYTYTYTYTYNIFMIIVAVVVHSNTESNNILLLFVGIYAFVRNPTDSRRISQNSIIFKSMRLWYIWNEIKKKVSRDTHTSQPLLYQGIMFTMNRIPIVNINILRNSYNFFDRCTCI